MSTRYPRRNSQERDKAGYPIYPLMLSNNTWLYEDSKGVTIVHEFRNDKSGVLFRCDQIKLPWPQLCTAVDSHRRARRRRKVTK